VHPRVDPRREPTHRWAAEPGMWGSGLSARQTLTAICAIDRPVREGVFFRRPRAGRATTQPRPAHTFWASSPLAVKRMRAFMGCE
jgi:hypothetical protein